MRLVKKGISYFLMTAGLISIMLIAGAFLVTGFLPQSPLAEQLLKAVNPEPVAKTDSVSEDIQFAFRTTLQNEVKNKIGMPIEGYEPAMFLLVFPGLTETDFEGVEASIGHYTVEKGRLVHKLDNSRLIHSAASAITDRGMDMLLANVSARLKVDLSHDGTLTKIMDALVRKDTEEESPEPVMCTMDAKICADGSSVGRVGPNCEFAPCP